MKVRQRILFAIAFTVIPAAIAVHYVTTEQVLSSFATLETRRATDDAHRSRQALHQVIEQLHERTVDWANWDDTYQFMADGNQAFLESNLKPQYLAQMKVDLIMLIDKSAKPKFSVAAKREDGFPKLSGASIHRTLLANGFLQSVKPFSGGQSGIAKIGDKYVLLSVRPIHRSDEKGESRGWMAFVKYLNSEVRETLQEVSRQDISLLSSSPLADQDQQDADARKTLETSDIAVETLGDSKVAAYVQFNDIHGKPSLILKSVFPRSVTAFGLSIVQSITYQLVGIAALLGLVITFVMERFALSRISQLTRQVAEINRSTRGGRVHLSGKDEFSYLAHAINGMLGNLELGAKQLRESEEKLRAHNENLEETVKERTREIEHQAFHDKLTGLPNRALFLNRVEYALEKAKRSQTGTAALFIDLDNFKLVNDSLGHDMGDRLLVAVSNRLSDAVRPGDTVSRLGGDEFTILLEGLSSLHEAIEVGQRILSGLREPILLGSRETFACASIGIAFAQDPTVVCDELLKNADLAMYRAKEGGKSNYVVFDESMHDRAMERLELETDLRRALEHEELAVHYQPLVNLHTHRLTGCEALARWEHPTRGFVPPSQFIPIAEDTGLIVPIGFWILEQACAQAQRWIQEDGAEGFVMSVNLSGKQLQRDDVVERVREILDRTGLPPGNLKLELTETVLLEDNEDTVRKMLLLKEAGVRLALDDFGTGYSSLSTLRSFPIDTLKIDRAFISRLGEDPEAAAIIEAIVGLARTMKMDVTGEGVETREQERAIRQLGCDTGQGFLYDEPLTARAFKSQFVPKVDAA